MNKSHLIWIVAVACALSSCVNEQEKAVPAKDRVPITFDGTIGADTKANTSGFQTGDRLGVYVVNFDNHGNPGTLQSKGNWVTNVAYTKAETWVPDYDVYYKDNSTHVDFYGYYPYISSIESVTNIPFEVKEDQSQDGTPGVMGAYEASDFLWAKRENVSPSASAVVLSFKHRMSQIAVTLEKGTGFGDTWDGLSKKVLISSVKRNANIDLTTGNVTATGAVSARNTVPYCSDGTFHAIVVPQEIAANTPLFTITIDGIPYTYSENSAFTYLQGKQHNFIITVNKKADGTYEFTSTSTIQPWDNDSRTLYLTSKSYVVVNLTGASTDTYDELTTKLTEMGISLADVKNLKLTGTLSFYDFGPIKESHLQALNLSEIQGINYQNRSYISLGSNSYWNLNNYGETDYYIPLNGVTTLRTVMFPENASSLHGSLAGTALSDAVTLPSSLEELDISFQDTNITSINLPNTLEKISNWTFYNCRYLSMTLVLPKGLKEIGEYAFANCSGLKGALILPETLEAIQQNAFSGCGGLTGSIIIPPKITTIKYRAFYGCSGITGLAIHDGVMSVEGYAFAMCNSLNGELNLPKSLINLGEYAFWNTSFSGLLEIQDGITAIPDNCFTKYYSGGAGFSEIILPEELMAIGQGAFGSHNSVKTIKSYAQDPPAMMSGAFSNSIASTVTIEVPNQKAVSDYYSTSGWAAFSNIHAHKDFSVDKDRIEALNDVYTTQIELETGDLAAWSVALSEGASEWITVTPESGTGSATLTVNISELPNNSGSREATITYVLIGEDYTVKTDVLQCNYTPSDYNYDTNPLYLAWLTGQRIGDNCIIPVWTHSHGHGIPIVFLGDGFDASDIYGGNYLWNMKLAISYFFDPEPYNFYRSYFDVYILVGMSAQSGMGTPRNPRDSRFGTRYGEDRHLQPHEESIFGNPAITALGLDLTKTTFVVVTNAIDDEGVTVFHEDGRTISYCPLSYTTTYPNDFGGQIQFEAGGRGFGRLGDERVLYNDKPNGREISKLREGQNQNRYSNLSESGSMSTVPWGHLFEDDRYREIVDIYEGGMGYSEGIYRSEGSSCMSNKIAYYNTVSREAIVRRIMELAGEVFTFEAFKANDVTTHHNETRLNNN